MALSASLPVAAMTTPSSFLPVLSRVPSLRLPSILLALLLAAPFRPAAAQCELERIDVIPFQLLPEGTQIGGAVAVSGARMVTTGFGEQIGPPGGEDFTTGAVYVHVREGDAWVLEERIVFQGLTGADNFGYEIALDGDVLAVGIPSFCVGDFLPGHCPPGKVAVYERGSAGWERVAVLQPADSTMDDLFGQSIALQGHRLVAGASARAESPGTTLGAAYVFERVDGSWVETAKLVGEVHGNTALFGMDVALDGDLIAVAAPIEPTASGPPGALYVFEHSGTAWLQRARLELQQWINGFEVFRVSVAVGGRRVLLGAPRTDQLEFFIPGLELDEAFDNGAVYVVEEVDGAFVHTATLRAGDSIGLDLFGASVAAHGDRVLVGASRAGGVEPHTGAAYLFEPTPLGWAQRAKFFAPDGKGAPLGAGGGDRFAFAVDMDGDLLAFGTPMASTGPLIETGATYTAWASPLPCPGQSLSGAPSLLSMAEGGRQVLHVQAGSEHAGRLYLFLGSASGTTPGLTLPGNVHIPLVPDPYFDLTLALLGQPPFLAGLGLLDGDGSATAGLELPPGVLADPVLIGLRLHHAALVFDQSLGGFVDATNAVTLRLVP